MKPDTGDSITPLYSDKTLDKTDISNLFKYITYYSTVRTGDCNDYFM
jgi:hypothetical protein